MKTKDRKTQCPNKNRLLGLDFRHLRRTECHFAENCCFCTTVCQVHAVFRGFPRAPRSERSATCFLRTVSDGRSELSTVPRFWGPRPFLGSCSQHHDRRTFSILTQWARQETRAPEAGDRATLAATVGSGPWETGRATLAAWCTRKPAKNRLDLTNCRAKAAIPCKIALDST